MGQLFKNPARLYVYPHFNLKSEQTVSAENFPVAPQLKHLYRHLLENRFIQGIGNYDAKLLPIRSRDVLSKIQTGDPAWEELVPPQIVDSIKRNALFGYRESKVLTP